ncbi:MAG: hypothetical protein LBO74_02555 [Candidatus Symbiothrix sp.]|jgi:hypothetical protein|nr:hypothetical protein [Candidatus Symbiothrix sp.]
MVEIFGSTIKRDSGKIKSKENRFDFMHKSASIIVILMILLPAFIFHACNDGIDDYSNNPNDRLVFSTDTVAFDTIITTINTPFQLFKVYNPHSKALLISSVYLENGEKSGFKINVDGRAGSSFEDIAIQGKDSLYVLVDAKPAKNASNQPEYITDQVVFVTNGVRQQVLLEASTQDAVIWRGLTVTSNSLLSNLKPFVIYDSLVVKEGITLEIKEGTTFYMHGNAELIVKGTLKAKGTLEKPVVIRGDRFDQLVDVPYDLVPGQWGGIRFESSSYNNEIEYAYIRNGKYGMDFQLSDPFQSKMKMKNVVLTNFKGVLINAMNCSIEAENCEFSNAKGALLNLIGGQYSFTHCTIANYYFSSRESGWGNSNHETVNLLGREINAETEPYPIWKADFKNCIIWGSEITFDRDTTIFIGHLFQNCVLPNDSAKNDPENDPTATVINCLIKGRELADGRKFEDPKFKRSAPDDFVYDFSLDSISPARNVADPKISRKIPYDIKGVDRFLDAGPDMGAYEWTKLNIP